MPTILDFSQQRGVLPGNPGEAQVNPSQFGDNFQALQGIGNQVTNLGAQFMEMNAKAEEADSVMNRSQEDLEYFANQKESLRKEYQFVDPNTGIATFDPRGVPEKDEATGTVSYPNSYAKRMKQIVEERYASGLEVMPSERARNSYRGSMDGAMSREVLNAISFETQETAQFFLNNKDSLVQKGVDTLYKAPSLESFQNQMTSMSQYYNTNKDVMFSGSGAVEDQQKSMRSLAVNGLFRGLLEKSPEQGLQILKGGGPKKPGVIGADEVKKFLTGDDVADWTERFNSKIKEKNLVEAHQLQGRITDMKAAALNGDGTASISQASALIERQSQLGLFKTPEQKLRAYSDMLSSMVVGENKRKMAGMTNSEIMAASANMEASYKGELNKIANREGIKLPPEFAAADVGELRQKSMAVASQVLKERETNPAGSVVQGNGTVRDLYEKTNGGMSSSPSVNEAYYDSVIAEQRRVGVISPKPLPANQVKALASQIMNADGEKSALMVEDLKNKTGKYFPHVMSQLVKDGDIPEYYVVAGYVDSPDAAKGIIDGMRNKGTFDQVLKDKNLLYRKSDLQGAVNQEFDDYFKAIVGQGSSPENLKIANGLRQAAYYDAASRITRGMSATEAAAASVDRIIRNKYEVYQGAFLPKARSEELKAAMDYTTSDEWIEKNAPRLYMPLSQGRQRDPNIPRTGDQIAADNAEKASRVKRALQDPNAHVWLSKPDGSGATLNFKIKNGAETQLLPVLMDDRSPVEVNWGNS